MKIGLLIAIGVVLFLLIREILLLVYNGLDVHPSSCAPQEKDIMELNNKAWAITMLSGLFAKKTLNKERLNVVLDKLTVEYMVFVHTCRKPLPNKLDILNRLYIEVQQTGSRILGLAPSDLEGLAQKLLKSEEYTKWAKCVTASSPYDFSNVEERMEKLLIEVKGK